MLIQPALITIDGIPVHPLLVHAVVVLLPLAALGGLVMAARTSWRRRFDVAVLLLTIAGVAAVPLAQRTGAQLQGVLPPNPNIQRHAQLGDAFLPFALAYGVAVLLLVVAGRLADRERDTATALLAGREHDVPAGRLPDQEHDAPVGRLADRGHHGPARWLPGRGRDAPASRADGPGAATATQARPTRLWRRLAIVAAALVAFSGVAMTVQIVRIGHSGSVAVWQGTGANR